MWNFKRDIYRSKTGCTPSCSPWVYTYGPWSAWSSCASDSRSRTRTIDGTRTCIADDCSTYIDTSSNIQTETSYCCPTCTAPDVTIGGQVWTGCNADVSTFRDGDPILEVTTKYQWELAAISNTPAWCYYNFDGVVNAKYGKLYNWHAVNDPRGLAPYGWHVPSKTEWQTLVAFIGGSMQGGALKSTDAFPCGFASPNTGATNSTGLSLLPGGVMSTIGDHVGFGSHGDYWTSTPESSVNAFAIYVSFNSSQILDSVISFRDYGYSVRFVQD